MLPVLPFTGRDKILRLLCSCTFSSRPRHLTRLCALADVAEQLPLISVSADRRAMARPRSHFVYCSGIRLPSFVFPPEHPDNLPGQVNWGLFMSPFLRTDPRSRDKR